MLRLEGDERYRDMAEVGSLLNAVLYASMHLPQQLAEFKVHRLPIRETIRLTSGLLSLSIYISKKMIDRYKDHVKVYQFREIVDTFETYEPPLVEVEMHKNRLFCMHWVNGDYKTPIEQMTGKKELFPLTNDENEGFAFASICLPEDRKEGVYVATLSELIETTVEDFVYAAEEFIFITAKELDLKPIEKPQRANLKLAA
jgi:hypothetical protein